MMAIIEITMDAIRLDSLNLAGPELADRILLLIHE